MKTRSVIKSLDLSYDEHYEGEVNALNKPHGQGKLVHGRYSYDYYVYEGKFRNGKRHGKGVLIEGHAPYEDRYEGDWKNDMRDGFGIQEDYIGYRYEGEWKENEHHGCGEWKTRDGIVYEGNIFDKGCIVGRGKITYPNGEVYEGEIRKSKRSGHGVMTYSDGHVYDGQWLDDQPFDEDLMFQMAEFTPEKIKDFCEKKGSWTQEYRDLDVREGFSDAGFAIDGRIHGFMWRHEWDDGPGSVDYYYCGLVDDQLKNYGFLCSVRYQLGRPYYDVMVSDYMPSVLLEHDDKGRIVFCGVHKDGVRHGLGSEFTYNEKGEISAFQGLWQNGKLTHRRDGDKLVSVE